MVAPDRRGGLWVGHVSGGRGVNRKGGLAHLLADGNARQYRADEPFSACSSVDALAAAPDGRLWVRLSGYHDYGQSDFLQTCGPAYGGLTAAPTAATPPPWALSAPTAR